MCKIYNWDELNPDREGHWTTAWKVRAAVHRAEVPVSVGWRAQFLTKFIFASRELKTSLEDTTEVDILIDSLCSS